MKRLLWTAIMAVGGFAIGWQDQGSRLETEHVLMITVWFAAIGFGFGSIFTKRPPRKWLLVFYWVFTLGLVAMIFSGFVPAANLPTQAAIAGIIGALLGMVVGVLQVKFSSSWRAVERSAGG